MVLSSEPLGRTKGNSFLETKRDPQNTTPFISLDVRLSRAVRLRCLLLYRQWSQEDEGLIRRK